MRSSPLVLYDDVQRKEHLLVCLTDMQCRVAVPCSDWAPSQRHRRRLQSRFMTNDDHSVSIDVAGHAARTLSASSS